MIDSKIRDIIAPELQESEELLWAETIDAECRTSWLKWKLKEDKSDLKFTLFIFLLMVFYPYISKEMNLFVTGMAVILLLSACYQTVLVIDRNGSRKKYLKSRNAEAYALSNQRIFILGPTMNLQSSYRLASFCKAETKYNLGHSGYGPDRVTLFPLKRLFGRQVQLFFLNNYTYATGLISRQIYEISKLKSYKEGLRP